MNRGPLVVAVLIRHTRDYSGLLGPMKPYWQDWAPLVYAPMAHVI